MIGELSALSAAFLWAFTSYVFTSATNRLGTIQLNIDRMAYASLLLLITIGIFGLNTDVSWLQVFYLTISGIIGLILGDSFLFKAFTEMGPRLTILVYSSNPAFAAIMAFLVFGETLTIWGILGIAITLFGISLVILEKNAHSSSKFSATPKGLFLAFLGAIGQAGGLIFAKMAFNEGDIHSLVATLVRIGSAVVIMLPIALIFRRYKNPFKLYYNDRKSFQLVSIGSVIGPYLGISLSFIAITHTNIGIASTLLSTVPIVMIPLNYFIYKEKLSYKSVIGAFIAVGGVSILFLI